MSQIDFNISTFWNPADFDIALAGASSDPLLSGLALGSTDLHGSSASDSQATDASSTFSLMPPEGRGFASAAGIAGALETFIPHFDHPDAAARAVLDRANPRSIADNVEYGGFVFRDRMGYFATHPGAGTSTNVSSGMSYLPSRQTLVGDYHTHGAYSRIGPGGEHVRASPSQDSFYSDQFSPGDKISNLRTSIDHPGFVGYLGTPSGNFRKYETNTMTDTVLASGSSPVATLARAGGRGALFAGLAEAAVLPNLWGAGYDGTTSPSIGSSIGSSVGHSAAAGGAFALAEHGLWRAVDRSFGLSLERSLGQVAASAGAAEAGAFGVLGRSLVTRAASAGGTGALFGAGLSVYDNFDALARGDSHAIGTVAGDAVVGTGAALSGAAAGAAVGSVVPFLGTASGAVAGMIVGIATDWAMRRSGVDSIVADAVGGSVDAARSSLDHIGRGPGF